MGQEAEAGLRAAEDKVTEYEKGLGLPASVADAKVSLEKALATLVAHKWRPPGRQEAAEDQDHQAARDAANAEAVANAKAALKAREKYEAVAAVAKHCLIDKVFISVKE